MAGKADAKSKRIKFENPPIAELGISLYYLPIAELHAQHIGIYWNRIRDRLPICEQQNPVALPLDQHNPFAEMPGDIFPLPRFWFYKSGTPTLVQIQRNAFMLNWRRLPEIEYPHYELVIEEFWREFNEYRSFIHEVVGGKIDVLHRCELFYTNLIAKNELFSNQSNLLNVVPYLKGFYDLEDDNRKVGFINSTITYVSPAIAIDLTTRLGRQVETGELAAVLELKAHGVPTDLSLDGARKWYSDAHDATYKLFLDSTAKQVQRIVWKPR